MYFPNVVGTGRYTTRTTNMYNKDFTHLGLQLDGADGFGQIWDVDAFGGDVRSSHLVVGQCVRATVQHLKLKKIEED